MPDFVQLRDENMTLLAYFTPNNADQSLQKYGLKRGNRKRVLKAIPDLGYGLITQIKI